MASISDKHLQDKRLLARVDDALEACDRGWARRFIGFLDEREAALVAAYVRGRHKSLSVRFFGGHNEAERVVFGVCSEGDVLENVDFPLAPIGLKWRNGVALSHRDVLGSLMGCSIAREKVGDILCEDGLAVVFVREELAEFIAQTLTTVGREGVTVICPYQGTLPTFHRFEEISGTVASVRLDAVLKVLLGSSREFACDCIRSSLVQVNHVEEVSVSTSVKEGDRISVRGYGRFIIDDVSEFSKKGRVILRARKFV